MKQVQKDIKKCGLALLALALFSTSVLSAQQSGEQDTQPNSTANTQPSTQQETPPQPASSTVPGTPTFVGPLQPPSSIAFEAGPLGKLNFDGIASVIGFWQSNHIPGESLAEQSVNLLYGPGSAAWSATLTPTYQHKRFFTRADLAWVRAGSILPGSAFGPAGINRNQPRGVIEAGFMF